jgi:hypothetical protein
MTMITQASGEASGACPKKLSIPYEQLDNLILKS